MSEVAFDILPLRGNYHLLPTASYFRQYCEEKEEDPENVIVAVHGNLEVSSFCLDNEEIKNILGIPSGNPVIILVPGNLKVDGNIWNANTDTATILYVNGSICAQNMIVGGQEILVAGNLELSGIFWGDYNHGMCSVNGNLSVEALLLTDQYDLSVTGAVNCGYFVHGTYSDFDVEEFMLEYIPYRYLDYDKDDECFLILPKNRARALKDLDTGSSLFKRMTSQSSLVFPNKRLSFENIQRLALSELAQNHDKEYEFDINSTHYKIKTFWEYYYDIEYKRVAIKTESVEFIIMAYLRPEHLLDGPVKKIAAKTVNWLRERKERIEKRVLIRYQNPSSTETDLIDLDENSDERLHDMLKNTWLQLLDKMPGYEYCWKELFSLITIDMVKDILDLPAAYAYPYFYEEDNSLWLGNLGMVFRREGEKCSQGIPRCARVGFLLCLPQDRQDEEGEFEDDYAQYLFDIEDWGTGKERLVFRYFTNAMCDNDEEPREVQCNEVYKFREAIRLLKRFLYCIDRNFYSDIFGRWKDGRLLAKPGNDFYMPHNRKRILEKHYTRLKRVIAKRCVTVRRKSWLCFAFSPGNNGAWMNLFYQIETGHILGADLDNEISEEFFAVIKDIAAIENKRKTPWVSKIFWISDCEIGCTEWDIGQIASEDRFLQEVIKWQSKAFAGFEGMLERKVSNLSGINAAVYNYRRQLYDKKLDDINFSEQGFLTIKKEILPGILANVTIEGDRDNFFSGLANYQESYRWLVENEMNARKFIVNSLYETLKENLEEDGEITKEDFYRNISLSGTLINNNGMVIYYNDDLLCGGRWITASVDTSFTFQKARIEESDYPMNFE